MDLGLLSFPRRENREAYHPKYNPQAPPWVEIVIVYKAMSLLACTTQNGIGVNFCSVLEPCKFLFNIEDITTIDTHARTRCNGMKEVDMMKKSTSRILPEDAISQSPPAGVTGITNLQ